MLDFRILRRRVYSAARHEKGGISNARFDTSDIAQESVLQLLKQNKRNGDFSVNQNYLSQVGVGNARRMLRLHLAQRRSLKLEQNDVQLDELRETDGGPVHGVIQQERFLNFIKAVASLTPDQQAVINCRYFDHMQFTEIARELEVPYDKVHKLYQQAVATLRELLA